MGERGSDGDNAQGKRSAQGQAGAATIALEGGPSSQIHVGGQGHVSGGTHTLGSTGPWGCGCFKGPVRHTRAQGSCFHGLRSHVHNPPPLPYNTLYKSKEGKKKKKKQRTGRKTRLERGLIPPLKKKRPFGMVGTGFTLKPKGKAAESNQCSRRYRNRSVNPLKPSRGAPPAVRASRLCRTEQEKTMSVLRP